MTTTAHAANLSEAIQTAKPIRGTRYALGSFLPTVGLSARPRPIYVLTLDGVEVDRGSKADLMGNAKSAPGSPLGVCHARYDVVRSGRLLRAEADATPAMTDGEKADEAKAYLLKQNVRHAEIAADELEALAKWATALAKTVRHSPTSGYTVHAGFTYLTKAAERLAKADALFTLTERASDR